MCASRSNDYLNSLSDELALALGQAVWAFARIEWLTYEYMKVLSVDSLDELMGDQLFKGRVKLVRQLVGRVTDRTAERDAAIAAIDRAESLADRRNTIVHNPWKIWIDFEQKDFVTEIQKYNRKEKKLNLTAVRKFTEESTEAAGALQDALSALTRGSSGLPSTAG